MPRKNGNSNFVNKDNTAKKNNNFKPNAKRDNNKAPKERKSVNEQTAKYITPVELRAGGMIEYKMPVAMIEELLKQKSINMDTQEYLCKYVNEQCGLLGTCIRVISY